MNRIDARFEQLRQSGEKALVGFLSAGDPDQDRSLAILDAACASGLDVLELGIPFSDPTSDGPVIQRASQRALAAGMTLERALGMLGQLRDRHDLPIILFSYFNPILAYGLERFARDARQAGADGVLIVDLPPEEADELGDVLATTTPEGAAPMAMIRLIAPTTPSERIAKIADGASGFLYVISMTGVTGAQQLDTAPLGDYVERIRRHTALPLCVGFGISRPEEAAAVASIADGVVVGSALERVIEANPEAVDLPAQVAAFVWKLKEACGRCAS